MNEKISKYIVWGNMAIVAIMYICLASIPSLGSSFSGFFFTLLHVAVNLGLAIILSIIHVITKRTHITLGKVVRGFWLSVGLVSLVSFPTCLLVDYVQPARF